MSGSVVVSGSSTVEPIAIIVGEKFKAANPDAGVTIDGPGTGDGFELFCGGETDVSDASRPIDDEEIAACEEAGIEFTELAVGIDGLTVATNPANADVECLDIPALYALLGPGVRGHRQLVRRQRAGDRGGLGLHEPPRRRPGDLRSR